MIHNARTCIISLLCLLFISGVRAQSSPYVFDTKRELALVGTGIALNVTSIFLKKNVESYTVEELGGFNRQDVPGFDRSATYNFSNQAAKSSDLSRNICIGLPLALLIGQQPRSEFGKVALLMGETYLLVGGVTFLSKTITRRTRPFVFNELVSTDQKQKKNAQFSFFSGHTSISSGLCFFGAKVFSDYYPESVLKPVVWTVAATLPAITGYLRVRAGRHFPSDAIAGYVIGAAGGVLVPLLHKADRKSGVNSLQIQVTGDQVGLAYRF